jgi:hypothetical protein
LKKTKIKYAIYSFEFHHTLFTLNGFPKTCCRTG